MIDTQLIIRSLPLLLAGTWISIKITVAALVIGIVLGTILGIAHAKASWPIRWLVAAYVTIIRGTPMLIQITFFYYVLPLLGISFSNLVTAILAIGFNSSAYISQVIKSGICAVDKDQSEAARVLGFTRMQTIFYIILPQAVRYVLPSLVNEGITLMKDSALASIIGVPELYKEARSLISQTYDVITIFVFVAAIYLVLTSIISLLAYYIERKMGEFHV